jgi:hypothetical protein
MGDVIYDAGMKRYAINDAGMEPVMGDVISNVDTEPVVGA